MSSSAIRVLAVDDEEFNLDIMQESLQDEGYQVVIASNGAEAWDILEKDSRFDVALIDRMMPKMDGIELTHKILASSNTKHIPVVMQTAAASTTEVTEGIKAGVFYYLTKPYDRDIMLSIVRAAVSDKLNKENILREVREHRSALGLLKQAVFEFRTMEEAKNICFLVANCYPEPEKVVLGITEFAYNAIEHGNLELGYNEKRDALLTGKLKDMVEERMKQAPYAMRRARMEFTQEGRHYTLIITDQGKGFDWTKFNSISPERATDPNGRGIILAKTLFDKVEYSNGGRTVTCSVKL